MSIISSRKSISTSILKTATSFREDTIRKSKQLRFQVENLSSVKEILLEAENGNMKEYMDLIYKLSQENILDETLTKTLKESIGCVQVFKIDFVLLIDTILNIRWINKSDEIIELYHRFIIDILTAKPEFLTKCCSKILTIFIPGENEANDWNNGVPSAELAEKLDKIHNLIKKIYEAIPMLPVTLRKCIVDMFPYYKQSTYKIAGYIYNLLKILDNCQSMMHDILNTIFESLLSIDLSLSRNDIEEAEEELIDEAENENNNADSETMKLPVAETLDVCMNLMFSYFYTKLSSESKTPLNEQKMIEKAIFEYFDEHILKTHNSKHVHFIFFYIASFKKSFLLELLRNLLDKILDRNKPSIIRQTAVGYLSSLLARAKYIPIELMKKYLEHLSNFAHDYIKMCNLVNINLSPRAHLVFHATCQAIFYIIAFRSKDLNLINSTRNLQFLLSLDLSPIVKHPLNPLNYCLPAIATIFDNVMTRHQILYCHTILVKNASKKLATVFMNEEYHPEEVLESVFPFDPYLLKKSGKKVHPIYIEYQSDEEDISHQNSPKAHKRTRNESECDDFFIIPSKKFKSGSID
ncbi:RNA polymerase I-specific transcription initiation factor RRN3 [Chironomus tepperi]|uniref:RNA polymerase I-specific transcription initiation factor RRN3 n=1 Tax=Chironomus tepperi TaxID=113505 RepID=UPI00391F6CFB